MDELKKVANEVFQSAQFQDRSILEDERNIYQETVEALGFDPLKEAADGDSDA